MRLQSLQAGCHSDAVLGAMFAHENWRASSSGSRSHVVWRRTSKLLTPRAAHVVSAPVAFALQVLRAFRANQGLLLAGAVAYYALLSIVPLLILMVIALSQ